MEVAASASTSAFVVPFIIRSTSRAIAGLAVRACSTAKDAVSAAPRIVNQRTQLTHSTRWRSGSWTEATEPAIFASASPSSCRKSAHFDLLAPTDVALPVAGASELRASSEKSNSPVSSPSIHERQRACGFIDRVARLPPGGNCANRWLSRSSTASKRCRLATTARPPLRNWPRPMVQALTTVVDIIVFCGRLAALPWPASPLTSRPSPRPRALGGIGTRRVASRSKSRVERLWSKRPLRLQTCVARHSKLTAHVMI